MSEVDGLQDALAGVYGLPPEQAVERLVGIYKHAASLIDALQEIQQGAKLILTEIMAETGQTDYRTGSGRCYVTRPGMTVRYDAKALDRLSDERPDLRDVLAPYRKESERPGVLTIR